jgi:hypothetical protein
MQLESSWMRQDGRRAAGIVRGVCRSCRVRAGRSSARPTLAWLATVALWSFPALAAAQEAQPLSPAPAVTQVTPLSSATAASFLIEKIVVTGVRHGSEGIVASETLLVLGRTYTESQLREALQRVERLPFVVMADFSLRRGSERGRFELVVTVVETKPIFFGGVLGAEWSGGEAYQDGWAAIANPELGARTFFGQSSELSATFGGYGVVSDGGGDLGNGSFNVAYRHHNLFSRHVVGTLSAGVNGSFSRGVSADLAVPVTATSVVGLHLTRSTTKSDIGPLEYSSYASSRRGTTYDAGLSWQRDTTDDPFAPRRGGRVGASGSWVTGHTNVTSNRDPWNGWIGSGSDGNWTQDTQDRGLDGSISAEHFWPVASRLAIGGAASFALSSSRSEGDVFRDGSQFRHTIEENRGVTGSASLELLGLVDPKRCGTGQCWWFLKTSLMTRNDRWTWDPPRQYPTYPNYPDVEFVFNSGFDFGETSVRTVLGLGARGRWGSVRLELAYTHHLHYGTESR